jgi:hypothetical protein
MTWAERVRVTPGPRQVLAVLILASALLCGCVASPTSEPTASAPTTTTPSRTDSSLLRIVNTGHRDIVGLVVLFPPSRRVEFGNVAAGQASGYREVPDGVYRYAAYEYAADGRVVTQPVVDWVGEAPMAGVRFTYRVEFDAAKGPGSQIRLVEVEVDEP